MLNLQAVELSKTYRGRKVVDDVELEIGQGEVVGLLGPNGAGKTTTFYIMVGLTRPDSGRVLLNGEEITDLPMYLRARSGISYLPQEPSVFRQLTSEENLLAVLETLPLTPEQQRDRLEELIVQMGLETVRSSKAYVLSGGERRRLADVRADRNDAGAERRWPRAVKAGRNHFRPIIQASHFSDVLTATNLALTAEPMPLTEATMTMLMPTAIMLYSIAVAPVSSWRNLEMSCRIKTPVGAFTGLFPYGRAKPRSDWLPVRSRTH